jgi:hypothetical protein
MQRDWTRLLPRKKATTNQERVTYLVEFITHRRGSRAALNKATKELLIITDRRQDNHRDD